MKCDACRQLLAQSLTLEYACLMGEIVRTELQTHNPSHCNEVLFTRGFGAGRGEGITICPEGAGHMVGGSMWRITTPEQEEIVYAVDCNHKQASQKNQKS